MTENNINCSILSRFRTLRDNSCDHTEINLKDDCLFNFLKIFTKISNENDQLESKSVIAYLNVLVFLSKDLLLKFELNDCFIISVYSIVKYCLWQSCRLVRTAALRCIRYYLLNYRHVELFMRMRVDYLIMRTFDISYEDAMNNQYRGSDDAERMHSMRLIYRLSLIAPKLFPLTLINTVVGICLIDADKNGGSLDIAIRPALMIMCHLVIINPVVVTHSRILDALQAVIFNADGRSWRLNIRIIEAVLLTQLKLVVHSEWRDILPLGYFNKTLTPFSILSNVLPLKKVELNYRMNYTDDQSDFVSISISVLCTILQSWPGLLYLCSSNNKPILSITGLLAVGSSEIRDRILDLLFQLFNVFRPALNCGDFYSCLRSFSEQKSAKNNPNWCLDDDFLVAQCNDCLPYISPNRINVLDNYEVMLLGAFIHNNLFEALANAVTDEKESTSARVGILLANISYKVSILFPSDHPLSRRSDTTKLLNNPQSHSALLWIEQVHKELEQYQFEITPFMTYIIQQHPTNSVNEDLMLSKRFLQPSNIEEILNRSCTIASFLPLKKNATISKSATNNRLSALLDQVTRHCHIFDSISCDNNTPYYDQWNWDLLLVFAKSLVDTKLLVNFDKELLNRVLKILMKFFIPQENGIASSQTFGSLPLTWKHSSKAAFVITDIIGFFVEFSKNSEPQEDLDLFLSTIRSYLLGCLQSVICEDKFGELKEQYGEITTRTDSLFTEYDLNYKCSSYLILAIGRMSASDLGEACLERTRIVEIFKTLLDNSRTDIYSKLILGSLDYTRPSLGRSLLSIATTSNNLPTRRYAIKFLRVLLRAKVPFFANWAVNILLKQLHDSDTLVKQMVFDILQEACEDESVINNLSIDSMAILQLGYSGFMLFSRLCSLPSHFEKLSNRNSINFMLDTWHEENYNVEYCKQLDELLMQHFTSYEVTSFNIDDPDSGRISNRPKSKIKELILPCHPYSSMSSHKDGLDVLINRGFLEDCVEFVNKEHQVLINHGDFGKPNIEFVSRDLYELQLRANMLASCHLTTSAWGLEYAIKMKVPVMISDITKFHPSLNVRGTGILCLGLIGSTPRGANILINHQWMALRSDRFDKWPLLLDVYHHLYQTREEVKRQLQAGRQPFAMKHSNSIFSDNTDGCSDNAKTWTTVGFSVFAMPLYSDDPGSRSRKVTYELLENIENDNEPHIKPYSKSLDDSVIQSISFSSISSGNIFSEEENQGRFNRMIMHHRDNSTGAASMFNVQLEETVSNITPHDVLGMATMRRIQKKSRTGLLPNKRLFQRYSADWDQGTACGQSKCCPNGDIFADIDRTLVEERSVGKRRKKFSSLITPKSNLNKYRGLVVPLNFNDLTINIFPKNGNMRTKASMSDSRTNDAYSLSSGHETGSRKISTKSQSVSRKSSKPFINGKISSSSGARSIEREDNSVSFPTHATSGYISLEESSCVLDLALLAIEDKTVENKTQRCSSDQTRNEANESISLRPRAITTSNCRDQDHSSFYSEDDIDSRIGCISNIVINLRDNQPFVDGNSPKIHELQGGLTYHHQDYCLHVGCGANRREKVSEDVIKFRIEILHAVSSLIVLSPRTKKMEMMLAKLKSNRDPELWSDPCLYSEISILLSLYNYSRQSRLYIQDLFMSVTMTKLADDMRNCFREFSGQSEPRCSRSTRL